ncbi:fibronectin type III domain-containing protein [Phycicoccus sp. KQZ13P-1]|uniref:Ig-like domain-containing protein n=1 Tax=Phycicoccus mangrovi TaxID=2840470 RepID=UPI001C007E0A|nr:Ig-like domain-containing protein [Phycicoccus mangrovi]MBT9258036.1 fibronectin type III domain-containing protein [Phycicoccus mangrovi]
MRNALAGRVRRVASVVVALLCVGSFVAYAVLATGYPVRKVDLDDSGIWVTSNVDHTFGRFNRYASFLDAFFNPPGGAQATSDLDVVQDGGTVLARDVGGGRLYPVDVRTGRTVEDAGVDVSPTAVVRMGGGTLAVLDVAKGEVRAVRYDAEGGLPPLDALAGTAPALAAVGPAPARDEAAASWSALAVGTDGGIHVVGRNGRLVSVPVRAGELGKPVATTVATQLGPVDVSAVGNVPVVLDEASGRVVTREGSGSVAAPEGVLRLQAPVAAGALVVASPAGLYRVGANGAVDPSAVFAGNGGTPAEPVAVAGCVWSAWAGSPGRVGRSCAGAAATEIPVDREGTLRQPVFRVNRGAALLNDVADGRIFDLERQESFYQWKTVSPPDDASSDQAPQKQAVDDKKNKPKAHDDRLGARPGRTTLLHVLDNDTDPSGQVLSISAVTDPGNPHASAVISPDGQTVRYTLDADGGDGVFEYDVSNGVSTARGTVTVQARAEDENEAPYRRSGVEDAELVVAAGGTIAVPVLDSWRDGDGDPVTIAEVEPDAGSALATPDGRIELTAPGSGEGGSVRIAYGVSDGRGDPTSGETRVEVQRGDATRALPPRTEPDVARGEAGQPISVAPLANDTQGADPLNPKAVLALAAPVAEKKGVSVETDTTTGEVVVTASRPGTVFLDYEAAFGSAPLEQGRIRIDALEPGSVDSGPVAMPDDAAVHGQSPVVVDVLANDVDPAGGILTVTAAAAEHPDQVQVAVLKGRWLRVVPTTAALAGGSETVRYTVTNGTSEATGDLVVTQLPAIDNDPPVTRPDQATVRSGDSVLVPVLDNDTTKGGRPLTLRADVPGQEAVGRLVVVDPAAAPGSGGTDLGTAYVAGDRIRYVAPASVTEPRTLQVEYVAENDANQTGTGLLEVTVTPPPGPQLENRAPSARPLEARAVAGEVLTIDVDPYGADPDGDSTSVLGVASAPTLGRVQGLSPTGIEYLAYPSKDSTGLDTFSYTITDRWGATSTSIVRVAVRQPGLPQPAVPVTDTVTATPGSSITVAPLDNDLYGATDPVQVRPLEETNPTLPEGTRLDPSTNVVTLTAPSQDARPTTVSYGLLGNAGTSTLGEIVVIGQDGAKNPPRVRDAVAEPGDGGRASADVLAAAYDPDGDTTQLTVTRVATPGTVSGGVVSVPMSTTAQSIPFEVTDESGATSAAVLHVPSAGAPGPFVRPDALIRVDEGRAVTVPVGTVVGDGAGKPVTLTTTDTLSASPAGHVTVEAVGGTSFTVTAKAGYVGPAAVTAEVTDGTSLDDPEGVTRTVTIPVQVGPETPVIRCPEDELTLVAGGRPLTVDPMSLCSVWAPTTAMADGLRFDATWADEAGGVSVEGSGQRRFRLDASGSAKPRTKGSLSVTATGTAATPSTLHVRVVAAPPPRLAPIVLPEMKQGETRTVDLASYLASSLDDAVPTAVSVTKTSGASASQSAQGSTVTITPAADAHGTMTFRVVASDVPDRARADRQVSGTISFQVFGRPDAPPRPQVGRTTLSHSASLGWTAPAANGAPIQGYDVQWPGGTQSCPSSPCTITGLDNGTGVAFQVRARNKAGDGDWSPSSATYIPDEAPKAVPNLRQTAAGDGSVTLAWGAAAVDGSQVTDYIVSVNGIQKRFGTALTGTVTGLKNGPAYTFTIVAKNRYRPGPSTTAKGMAAGTPGLDGPVTFGPVAAADSDTTAVDVRWPAGQQNGPSPILYTVTRTTDGKTVCADTRATHCVDDGVRFGTTYRYAVLGRTTFLGVTRESATRSASISPVGRPAGWSAVSARPTGANRAVTVDYSVPASRGASSTVSILVNGSAVTTFAADPGGVAGQSRTVSVPVNGVDYKISMSVCNESDVCSVSNPVTVNAYGPVPAPTISLSRGGSANRTFTVQVRADGNGRPVTATVTTDSGQRWTVSSAGAIDSSWSYAVDYGTSDRAHVTISDSAGRPVPGRVSSGTQTSDPRPQPKIYVSHDGAGLAYIRLQGFTPGSNVYCHVDGSGGFVNWDVTWRVDGSGNHPASTRGNQGNLNDPTHLLGDGEYTRGDLCVQR